MMKYFSIETVVNAYKGFQDCMTNKSWGYLAILKGCQSSIRPSVPYEVDMDVVANFLENIFNLSQTKRIYDGGRSLYVVFSNKWDQYFKDQGRCSPDIFDVIVWAYRRRAFSDNVTNSDLITIFSEEFNIPTDIIENSFNTRTKVLAFTNSLHPESQLKSELSKIGVDVTKNNIDAKRGGVVASPGEISRGPFVQTLYAGLDITDYVLILQSDYYSLYGNGKDKSEKENNEIKSLQQIFYGAPGTSKSNTIKKMVDEQGKKCYRITFHPDSDYSTFVGAYKPKMKESYITKDGVTTKEEKIIYTFCPQAFTDAYVEAWNTKEEVYLIIEEINRGNCAQIFGDLFQLLDRKNGISEYPVEADADLQSYLQKSLADTVRTDIPEDVKSGKKLILPSNLYIWATMNTSDQSLFPIDSAFKRRWDWKFMKIRKGKDENGNELDWKIVVKDKDKNIVKINNENSLSWWDFIEKINEIIASMTSSADKQLGYFFCKADEKANEIDKDCTIISANTFVGKVLFYLWNDVFKDYGFEDASLFRYKETKDGKGPEKDLTFPDFYDEDGENVNTVRVVDFVQKVMNWKKKDEEND